MPAPKESMGTVLARTRRKGRKMEERSWGLGVEKESWGLGLSSHAASAAGRGRGGDGGE